MIINQEFVVLKVSIVKLKWACFCLCRLEPVVLFLGKITAYEGGASEFMVGPVYFFLLYNDHMVGYRFLPTSLESCRCDIFWFVHEDAQEGKDYDHENLTWLWGVTTRADKEIIVNNQKGVDSRFYTPLYPRKTFGNGTI
ncbi:SRPBCC family protein [Paremcibacter congregatus]|uniref:SRPBCC family protein n=1 Tax=Paremcibacter congregatus TaxID=2043170 RepID=UPI003A8DDC09